MGEIYGFYYQFDSELQSPDAASITVTLYNLSLIHILSGGTAIWGTPPLKTVTFGINVNF